jgi:hypothetical protein
MARPRISSTGDVMALSKNRLILLSYHVRSEMFLIYSDCQIYDPINFAVGVIARLEKNISYEFIKIERRIE